MALRHVRHDEAKWLGYYEKLRRFKAENGHCIVPRRHFEDPTLAQWVNRQRKQYKDFKNGEKSCLTAERILMLEKLSFEWDAYDATWNRRFEQLREYLYEHGDCDVPRYYAQSPALHWWVFTQRKQYRFLKDGKPSSLTEDRIKALDSLGFIWDGRGHHSNDLWSTRVMELQHFKDTYGHCKVKENHSLGRWVRSQREQYRRLNTGKPSSMTRERVDTLTRMGFTWEAKPGRAIEEGQAIKHDSRAS